MDRQTRQQALTLLEKAGLPPDLDCIRPVSQAGLTNQVSTVGLADGRQYILRQYRWPHDGPDTDRLGKEIYLHQLLQDRGIPVAPIRASIAADGQSAVLMDKLPGLPLGDLPDATPRDEQNQAWYACGQALGMVHQITYPPGSFGAIVGQTPQADGPSWGHWQMYNILHHAAEFARRQSVVLSLEELQKLLERALPSLNQPPPALVHNDPHPWNVLVVRTPTGWQCSGWLDWEYAWVADPTWDLVRMDLFRLKPIGPTPASFYQGYGGHPTGPNRSIYELSIHLWQANEYLRGRRGLEPTYAAALTYLSNLEDHLTKIGALLTG